MKVGIILEFKILKNDAMTPKERSIAFNRGESIDRIPCSPAMGITMTPYLNRTTKEYYNNPEVIASLEIELFKRLGHDSVGVGMSLRGIAEAMGTRLHYPENGISSVAAPILQSWDDIDGLRIINPWTDGKIPLRLDALQRVKAHLGHLVDVGSDIPAPLSAAAAVVGTDQLLKAMVKAPEKVHHLLEIVTINCIQVIDVLADMDLGLCFSDPVASTSLISPKQYREFALPYTKKCYDRKKKLTGSTGTLHICGRSKEIWHDMVETGMTNLSLDNCESLLEAKMEVGDQVVISGNVPPVNVMHVGPKESIVQFTKACIRDAHDNPKGFILSTGCQIPLGTSLSHVDTMMEAARIYGKYPLNWLK